MSSVTVGEGGSQLVGFFCAGSAEAGTSNTGEWLASIGSLQLTVCPGATLAADTEYKIEWMVQNPLAAQSSPPVSIEVSGPVPYFSVSMDKFGTEIYGVPGGIDPMEVVVPTFTTLDIGQDNFLAGEVNTISVTLTSNVDLDDGDNGVIHMCCFLEAQPQILQGDDFNLTEGDDFNLTVASSDAKSLPGFCGPFGLNFNSGRWNSSTSGIALPLCFSKLDSHSEFVVTFRVKNPPAAQASPAVTVGYSGGFVIADAAMVKPGGSYEGVVNGADPMHVLIPQFVTRSIFQSWPFVTPCPRPCNPGSPWLVAFPLFLLSAFSASRRRCM